MPININQVSNTVQTRVTDQLNTESPNALKSTSKFGLRITNFFTSKAGVEKKNSQIAAKLLSSLTSQVGQTIANRAVSKLLSERNVKIISSSEINEVIKSAADDYAKTLAAFTESPITKEFLPGGSKAPANLTETGKESYTNSFISHCLAQSFDIGITPGEMTKLLANGSLAGHPEHFQALEQLSQTTFPKIASYCESIGEHKFKPNATSISYKELGEKCMKGCAWYGKPKEEADAIMQKRLNGEKTPRDKLDVLEFGDMKVLRLPDPSFISVQNRKLNDRMKAQGFDTTLNTALFSDNKLHISVDPADMVKAFQVLFPLLTSSDMPFDELKFTNFECVKPLKAERMAENRRLMTEGATPEIRSKAADEVRMGDRVHLGNQFTFYCPTYSDPATRKESIKQQKEFIQVLEQELKKAGVKPGDKTEGHELPALDFTTYRWEGNPRIPSAQLEENHLAKVRGSDVYQAFNH